MNHSKRVLIAVTLAAGAATLSPAWATGDVREIPMKDGSTLLIFKDGKMSMRDKSGRTMNMKDGVEMETKDGKRYVMRGNEIWRRTEREELYNGG